MKGSLLVVIFALFISTSYCGCDFTITSKSDLQSVLAAQTWAPATKVLCFTPNTYTYNDGPALSITAPQEWRGARVNVDPTCKQHVNPPCSRLQSAVSFDDSVETVFHISTASNPFAVLSAGFFNFTGFSVYYQTSSSDFINGDVAYLYDNYLAIQGPVDTQTIYAYYNYFDGMSGTNPLLTTSVTGILENNYFTNSVGAVHGSWQTIQDNSFVGNALALSVTSVPVISNNLFVLNSIVGGGGSGTHYQDNSFIFNDAGIDVSTSSYTVSTTGNCFLDNNTPLSVHNPGSISVDHSGNNYFGLYNLATGGFYNTGSGQLGSPEQTPNALSSPLVCPKTFFSAFVLHPNNVILGQPIDIYWTFKTGNSLLASGLDLNILNQTTVTFYIYDGQYDSSASFTTLSLTDITNFNKFGVAYNSLSYTPQFSDFATSPMHGIPNSYTLVAKTAFTTSVLSNSLSHTFVAAEALIVQFDIPEVCRDRSDVVEIPKTARFNGPVTLNLTQLFCDTVQWNISSINQQPLHAPAVSDNGDNSVSFTIDPNSSGHFNFVLSITSLSQPSLVHRLLAKVNIINTNPYVTPYRYFNFTQLSEVNGVNLLFNSSDADSDTVTIKSIFPRGDKNFTKIDALSVYFHFNGTGFVVVSDASGNLSVHDVDLTNPQVPATAGAFSGKFKFSFGINFVATDGDRSNQYAEGSVIFHHIPSSSS